MRNKLVATDARPCWCPFLALSITAAIAQGGRDGADEPLTPRDGHHQRGTRATSPAAVRHSLTMSQPSILKILFFPEISDPNRAFMKRRLPSDSVSVLLLFASLLCTRPTWAGIAQRDSQWRSGEGSRRGAHRQSVSGDRHQG